MQVDKIRAGLFAVSIAALLVGYNLLILSHAPGYFQDAAEDLSHGWFVPLFSLYVLWRERQGLIADAKAGVPSVWGLLATLPFFFLGLLGLRGSQLRFEIVGLVGLLLTLTWAFFGGRILRRAAFPILFLLFCMPLHTFLDVITIHLRLLASSVAFWVLKGGGADIVQQGTMLMSSTGSFAIDIAEPCSGMRSLFAMMTLTAAYAYFTQPTWLRRGILFAASIPIAVLGNIFRTLSIVAVASSCSSEFATGFYHDYSGYVVFLTAILLMVASGGIITKLFEKGGRECDAS